MIKVVFFANLREQLDTESLRVDSAGVSDVRGVIGKLSEQQGEYWLELLTGDNILVAVNQEMVNHEAMVDDEDEVAFFPPVTGG